MKQQNNTCGAHALGRVGLILAGAFVSVVFWLIEASVHVLVLKDSDLAEAIFAPPAHEVWMRLTIVSMFMAFAVSANRMVEARRRAEYAAKRANAEVNQIFETAADGMRVVDRDFRVKRANDTFASLAGLPKQEIIDKKCYEVFRGHLCDTPGCPLTRVLAGAQRIEYDAEKLRLDGRTVPCIVTATPYRNPDGEICGIVEDFKDISERQRAESELVESQQRLRELTSHLQVVREEERSRIAREIHDELGQALTALKMDLHWLRKRLPGDARDMQEKAAAMDHLIGETVRSVRRICTELRPGVLDDFGLAAAIDWQAAEFAKRSGIACNIRCEPEEIVPEKALATTIFRIFQETLTNVARHADATRVDVELTSLPNGLSLRVSDNGRGMSTQMARPGKSFGLLGIQERVRGFGGELTISPGEAGGTCIEVTIPSPEKGKSR